MKWFLLLVLCLVGCVAPSTPATVTAQDVIDRLNEGGATVTDVKQGERNENSPMPNSYDEHLEFTIPEVAPKGGQIFVCRSKRNCDALYAYFNALVAIAGPYLYQSPNGLVVAQLNSGLTTETAEKFEKVIQGLP